jgi:serine/threonine protein kinase
MWKIADFGTSTPGTSKRLLATPNSRGTPSYRAPEILRDPENAVFNNKVDIWGFGCILWDMIDGTKLFAGGDGHVMFYAFSLQPLPVPDLPSSNSQRINEFSQRLLPLLATLLDYEGQHRPAAQEVHDALDNEIGLCTREIEAMSDSGSSSVESEHRE